MSFSFSTDNARTIIDSLSIPPMPEPTDERGIVIAAGGRYNVGAYLLIRLLKHLGCELPIQVWYLPKEKDEVFIDILKRLGVTSINAGLIQEEYPHECLHGWEVKSYMIKHCPFREVLLLDADNFPTKPPDFIFDTEQFKIAGAMFFPDVRKMALDSPFWSVFNIPIVDDWEFESGAIFIDRVKCWKEICIADFINEHGTEFYWSAAGMLGDKDSWKAAFGITGREFAWTGHPVVRLESTMLQYDFDGEVLFQHRNMSKFNLFDSKRIDGFQLEDELYGFMDDLKEQWLTAKPEDCSWINFKKFHYFRLGMDSRDMVFEPNGVIGQGAGGMETFYYCSGGDIYMVGNNGMLTAIFKKTHIDRLWLGRWFNYEKCPVLLWER